MQNYPEQPPQYPPYPQSQSLTPPPPANSYRSPYGTPPPQPPRRRRLSRRAWIIIIVVILLLAIIGAISNAASPSASSTDATPTAGQAAQSTQAGQPTQVPTLSPTPKLQKRPSRAQLEDLIAPMYPPVTIESYQQSTGTLVVSVSYGEGVNWNQAVMKKTMADTQAKFWAQDWYFSSITVNVYELLMAGGQRKMAYGVLKYQTAQTINFKWGLYGDLWSKYDQKWMDPRVPSE